LDNQRNLYSVAEAAKQLERSTEQVRRYLREGRLKGRRMGGQWFIDRDALDTFQQAAQIRNDFVSRLKPASEIRALENVIGIGEGPGSNISNGKSAYRNAGSRTSSHTGRRS
jgi:excisionase family DNA binding protein